MDRLFKGIEHKMIRLERLGRKRLAYEINRVKDGFIVTCLVEMDPASVEVFRRTVTLSEDVLRLTIVSLDALAFKTLTTPRPPRDHEGRDRDRGPRGDSRGPRGEFRGPGGPMAGRRPPFSQPQGQQQPQPQQPQQGDAR